MDRLGRGYFDLIDTRGAGTFTQTRVQASQLFACAVRQDFDCAVGVISYPSGDLKDVRFALHEPAKADALHTSANQETASAVGRLIFC